ncbi:putative transcription initiation protein spt5 protein [Golovinomyces cichoracearum]|uniref:Putative transcription initiation protein spt5 protein n=1 Tax=Golovinomyces cichoracearum TaxID=62708 RepID=A0A420IWY2_9PEZI|nr:putative transcription initiation protein spt5 protein [Golovinomyces cichoracearum]
MIGNSKFEYFYIKFFIIFLHNVAHLCLCYCIGSILFCGIKKFLSSPFSYYPLFESLFFLSHFPYCNYLQRDAIFPSPGDREERKKLVSLCHQNLPNPENYLRQWFLGADLREIKRENVKDFILWAFFNRGGHPDSDDEELNEYIDDLEMRLGRRIEKGRGNVSPLRLNLDRVNMLHRSILWYGCVGFVDFITYCIMSYHGFNFHRIVSSRFFTNFPFRPLTLLSTRKSPVKSTAYWYREHKSKNKNPIVFIHGIGIGLYPYTSFLKELRSDLDFGLYDPDDQVGIFAIENLHISSRLTHAPPTSKEICSHIEQILLNHFPPDQEFVFVAHSFGTATVSLLLKNKKTSHLIKSIVLIDPIPILLHLPNVAYNFTRRTPTKANEHQLHYFANMDMGIAHTLGRHFFWNEVVLWKETFGSRNVTVSLSGQDLIVDTEAVGRYLSSNSSSEFIDYYSSSGNTNPEKMEASLKSRNSLEGSRIIRTKEKEASNLNSGHNDEWKYRPWKGNGIDILWFEDLDHAQVFDKKATRRMLRDVIFSYCRRE